MHGFFAFFIAVDDQVEDIAGFGYQRDKLLAFTGHRADIVHQSKVAVRREAVDFRHHLGFLFKESGKHGKEVRQRLTVDIEGIAFRRLLRSDVVQLQVLSAHIAVFRREFQLVPAVFFAHDLHFGAVCQAVDDIVADTRAGTDIQVAAVGPDPAGLHRVFFRFPAVNGNGHGIVGHRYMERRQEMRQKLRVLQQDFHDFRVQLRQETGIRFQVKTGDPRKFQTAQIKAVSGLRFLIVRSVGRCFHTIRIRFRFGSFGFRFRGFNRRGPASCGCFGVISLGEYRHRRHSNGRDHRCRHEGGQFHFHHLSNASFSSSGSSGSVSGSSSASSGVAGNT